MALDIVHWVLAGEWEIAVIFHDKLGPIIELLVAMDRGRKALRHYGCAACHTTPEVPYTSEQGRDG